MIHLFNISVKQRKFLYCLVLLLLIFFAFFPRSIEIFNQNPIFGFDQGRDYLAVKNIVINHKLTLIGEELGAGSAGISGVFQGPGFFYFLTIPFVIFNGNPSGGVVLMLTLSLLAIVIGFMLGKRMFGIWGGLLIALLISISSVFISQARFVWNPNAPTLFILLSLYFLYSFLTEKKNIYIFLSSFFSGFIYNFEIAVSAPLCLALFIFSLYLFKKEIKQYAILLSGFLIAFSPMILFEIRHKFMALKGLASYLNVRGSSGEISSFNLVIDHFKPFVQNFGATFNINNFSLSFLLLIILLGLTMFFVKQEKNRNLRQFMLFLLFLIPINLVIFLFLRNIIWGYYLTDLNVAYVIFFSYIFVSIYKKKYRTLTLIVGLMLVLFVLIGVINAYKTSFHDYFDYGGTAKIKGKIDAIDYIYKDVKGKQFGLLIFNPPVYTYPYDYILWWYGQKKYGYLPYNEKKETFYLLIEPDPSKPWSYKGWLETVIKTGTILETKTLPSGFIIQKRLEKN